MCSTAGVRGASAPIFAMSVNDISVTDICQPACRGAGRYCRAMRAPHALRITGPMSDALTAFDSLAEDMDLVQLLLEQMLGLPDPEMEDDPAAGVRGFWAAAVVTYARCFNSGQRKAFARTVRIPHRFRRAHDWLLSYRDATVAHRSRVPIDHYDEIQLWWRRSPFPPYWAFDVYPTSVRLLQPTIARSRAIHRLAAHLAATYARLADDVRTQLTYTLYGTTTEALLGLARRRDATLYVPDSPMLPDGRRLAALPEDYRSLEAGLD
jgi:hypothetical protein